MIVGYYCDTSVRVSIIRWLAMKEQFKVNLLDPIGPLSSKTLHLHRAMSTRSSYIVYWNASMHIHVMRPLLQCFRVYLPFSCVQVCAKSPHSSSGPSGKPQPIMLNFLPIMLLSNDQKIAYMLNIIPMTTAIMPQLVFIFND